MDAFSIRLGSPDVLNSNPANGLATGSVSFEG